MKRLLKRWPVFLLLLLTAVFCAGEIRLASDRDSVGYMKVYHSTSDAGILPPTGNDAYTIYLTNCDGADTSTTFTDSSVGGSTHTITASGNAQVDTAQKKFGTGSLLCDGADDWIYSADHADFDFGTGAVTIDFWMRIPSTISGATVIMSHGGFGHTVDVDGWSIVMDGSTINFYVRSGSGANNTATFVPAIDTWYHIAFVRESDNTTHWFIDGIEVTITPSSTSTNLDLGTSQFRIGANHEGGNDYNGWVDEPRVSKGVARWTTNFTPPTAPY